MADGPKYSDDDVRAIIDRALNGEAGGAADLSHAELLAVGEQVGVSADAMTRAATEVRMAKLDAAASRAIATRRRRWLNAHIAAFAVINGLLYAVNAATTPGQWWVLFSIFFWGLALTLHAGLALGITPSRRALDRERRRLESPTPARASKLRVDQELAEAEASDTPLATQDTETPPGVSRANRG